MSRFFKAVLPIGVLCGIILGGTTLVSAKSTLTDEELNIYSQNNITFYEPCNTENNGEINGCNIKVSGSTIEEKIWTGLTSFLSDEQAAGVMGNMAHEGGFNPARHESAFINSSPNFAITKNTDDSYGIGLIQWSFGRRVRMLDYINEKAHELLDKFIDTGRNIYGKISGQDFLDKAGDDATNQLIMLELCFLKQELEGNSTYSGLMNTSTVDEASDYFLEHVEVPADIPGQMPIRRDDANKYYNQFHGKDFSDDSSASTGESDPSCNACVPGSLNINGAAVCLAWPLGTDEKVNAFPNGSGTDLFTSFWESDDKVYKDGGPEHKVGAYCCGFSAAAVHFSGYDPDFASSCGHDDHIHNQFQYKYAKSHPDLWEVIPYDKSILRGGDVIYYSNPSGGGHSYVIVQDEKGELYIAEASQANFFGVIHKYRDPPSINMAFIFRAKNARNNSSGISVTDGVKSSSTTGTLSSGKTSGNGDINASAFELAWPEGTSDSVYRSKAWDKFVEAFNALPGRKNRGGQAWNDGKSCMVFVNTVLQYAGALKMEKLSSVTWDLIKSDDWEEVGGEGNDGAGLTYEDLEPGDVLSYFAAGSSSDGSDQYKGLGLHHEAIYGETPDGKGRIIEAGFEIEWGHVNGKKLDPKSKLVNNWARMVRVFRWKKQSGDSKCDVCAGVGDDSGGGWLKEGGYSSTKEAEEIIKEYHKKWKNDKPHFGDVCDHGSFRGSPHANCTNFSMWFAYNYMHCTDLANKGVNGYNVADKVYSVCKRKFNKIKKSNTPSVYSIVSWNSPVGKMGSFNHTAVVVGINKEKNQIIFADAAWCSQDGRIWEDKLNLYEGRGTYVDISDYVTGLRT